MTQQEYEAQLKRCQATWPANGTTIQCSKPNGHPGSCGHKL